MTLEQIRIYRWQSADAGQTAMLSAAEARSYRQTQHHAKSAWVEGVLKEIKQQ